MQNIDRGSSSNNAKFIIQKKDGISRPLHLVYDPKTRQNPPPRPTMAGRPPGSVNIVAGAMFGVPQQQRAQLATGPLPTSSNPTTQLYPSTYQSFQRKTSSSNSSSRMNQHSASPNGGIESPPALDNAAGHESDDGETEEQYERRIQKQIEKNIMEEKKRFEMQKKANSGNVIKVEGQSIEEFEVDDLEKVLEEEEKSKRRMLEESNKLVYAATKLKSPKRSDKYQKTDEELQEQNEKIHAILENAKSQMNEEDKKTSSSNNSISLSRKRVKEVVDSIGVGTSPTLPVPASNSVPAVETTPEEAVVPAKRGRGKHVRHKKEKDNEGTSTGNSSDYEEESRKKKRNSVKNKRQPSEESEEPAPVESPAPAPVMNSEERKTREEENKNVRKKRSELDRLLNMDFGPKEGGTLKDLEEAKTGSGISQRRAALEINRKVKIEPVRRNKRRSNAGKNPWRYDDGDEDHEVGETSNKNTPEKNETKKDEKSNETPKRAKLEKKEEKGDPIEAPLPKESPNQDAHDEKEAEDSAGDQPKPEEPKEESPKPARATVPADPRAPVAAVSRIQSTPPCAPVPPTNSVNPVSAQRIPVSPPPPVPHSVQPEARVYDGEQLDYLPPGCTTDYMPWTVEQCVDWISVVTNSTRAGDAFRREEIDGSVLDVVPIEDFRTQMAMPYGPFIKIRNALVRLRERRQAIVRPN